MRILGIDPGSRITGYGVIDGHGSQCALVATGALRLGEGLLGDRLLALHRELSAIVAEHRPQAVAVEGIFTKISPRSALILAHARGVALLCAAQADLPLFEYPPATVKRSLTQGGAASKGGVARAVNLILGLREPLVADASDALAVAVCHLSKERVRNGSRPGTPSAWVRALTAAPPRRQTAANALLEAAWRRR